MNILIATPAAEVKRYALDRWAEAVKAQSVDDCQGVTCREMGWHRVPVLVVDNTAGAPALRHFCAHHGFAYRHIEPPNEDFWAIHNAAWAEIVQYATDHDYEAVAAIDSDIIVPPNFVEYMVGRLGKAPSVAHLIPGRHFSWAPEYGIGANLYRLDFLRRLPLDGTTREPEFLEGASRVVDLKLEHLWDEGIVCDSLRT